MQIRMTWPEMNLRRKSVVRNPELCKDLIWHRKEKGFSYIAKNSGEQTEHATLIGIFAAQRVQDEHENNLVDAKRLSYAQFKQSDLNESWSRSHTGTEGDSPPLLSDFVAGQKPWASAAPSSSAHSSGWTHFPKTTKVQPRYYVMPVQNNSNEQLQRY